MDWFPRMRAMSLVSSDGDGEQNEIRNLQEKLESTMKLVSNLSGQLTELKEQVGAGPTTQRPWTFCFICFFVCFYVYVYFIILVRLFIYFHSCTAIFCRELLRMCQYSYLDKGAVWDVWSFFVVERFHRKVLQLGFVLTSTVSRSKTAVSD